MHYVTLLVQMFMISRVSHWFAYSDIASVHNWCTNVECCLCCCLQRVFWEQIRTGCYYGKHSEQVATFHIWVFSIKKNKSTAYMLPSMLSTVTCGHCRIFLLLQLITVERLLSFLACTSKTKQCWIALLVVPRSHIPTLYFTSYVVIYDTMHNV